MKMTRRLAVVLMLAGCAASNANTGNKYTNERTQASCQFERSATGVPVLAMPADVKVEYRIAIEPKTLDTWARVGTDVVYVKDKPMIAINIVNMVGEDNAASRGMVNEWLANMRPTAVERLFDKGLGQGVGKKPTLKPSDAIIFADRKAFALTLCDEACFASWAKEVGVTMTFAQALEKIAAWRSVEAIAKQKEAMLADLRTCFTDVQPQQWGTKKAPWWLGAGPVIVNYVDGKKAVVAVGVGDGGVQGQPARNTAADRGRAALSSYFFMTVAKTKDGKVYESKAKLKEASAAAFFEQDGRVHSLIVCDAQCLARSASLFDLELTADVR